MTARRFTTVVTMTTPDRGSRLTRRLRRLTLAFALALTQTGALLACGGPRPERSTPPPPPYPPPVFDATLAGPDRLGQPLETVARGHDLDRVQAPRSDVQAFVEYLSNHPYVLAVHYLFSAGPVPALKRLTYELRPGMRRDAALRLAFLNGLIERYGLPDERPTPARPWHAWHTKTALVRWDGARVDMRPLPKP